MDALTGADQARFERHLTRCPECTREISELGEATEVRLETPDPLLWVHHGVVVAVR